MDSNNPHAVAEGTTREGPKTKVFCALSKEIEFRPFFLAEGNVTGVEHPGRPVHTFELGGRLWGQVKLGGQFEVKIQNKKNCFHFMSMNL